MSVAWNDIRQAVVERLSERHPDVVVSGQSDPAEPTEAHCFVHLASASQARLTGMRYRRTATFEIRFASPDATFERLHGMAESMYGDLERIETPSGGSMRGSGMSHAVEDGKLRFAVTFVFDVVRQRAASAKMERLEQEGYLV